MRGHVSLSLEATFKAPISCPVWNTPLFGPANFATDETDFVKIEDCLNQQADQTRILVTKTSRKHIIDSLATVLHGLRSGQRAPQPKLISTLA